MAWGLIGKDPAKSTKLKKQDTINRRKGSGA